MFPQYTITRETINNILSKAKQSHDILVFDFDAIDFDIVYKVGLRQYFIINMDNHGQTIEYEIYAFAEMFDINIEFD